MVHPLLHGALHPDLVDPVHILCRSLVVGGAGYQVIDLLGGELLGGIYSVGYHPLHELVVEHYKLLKCIAVVINECDVGVLVIAVDLAAALVNGHEYRLQARCGLSHKAYGAGGGYGKARYVTAAVFLHVLIELWIGLLKTEYEGVVLLAFPVKYLKRATLTCHLDR